MRDITMRLTRYEKSVSNRQPEDRGAHCNLDAMVWRFLKCEQRLSVGVLIRSFGQTYPRAVCILYGFKPTSADAWIVKTTAA